jgi:CheY-like chemotaxis protein
MPDGSTAPGSTAPRSTAPRDPVRVLLVEDSDDQRELLRAYFEKAGCEVVAAKNAEEAIPSYRQTEPELAVIDLVLPGMDGWALVEKLRADLPGCAVVITSVLGAERYPKSQAILPKPFTRAQVLRVLADCVPRWATA